MAKGTYVLWLTVVLAAVGRPGPTVAQSNRSLREVADRYWEALMERYPTWATELGDYRYNDRLEDLSAEGRRKWKDTLGAVLSDVEAIDPSSLANVDRLTHSLLERSVHDRLARLQCGLYRMPLDPLAGVHLQFPLLLVSQPFRSETDFRAYIARLDAFPRQVDDVITNMREGLSQHFVEPCAVINKVVPQIKTQLVKDASKSTFYAAVEQAKKLPEPDRERVVKDLTEVITGRVIPAYRRLLTFVTEDYLPACRHTVGIGSVPGGAAVYDTLVRLHTTVDVSPEKVHEIGLAEVARIRREMEKIKAEVGFDGTLDQFIAHMRTAPRYRFRSAEELVTAADAILKRTKLLLPRLFGRLPKADCVMKEIESFRAPAAPVAYYNPTPEDGSRPGYYYINTYAPHERLRFTLEALTYHEAVPGHHLQMALDQENRDIPKFRRYGSFTAYVEGWALYSEKLGYDMGGYKDPYSRYGQLTFEMWRACRLVVDTGMHAKGWSREQAIDFMATNTSLAPLDIESEVDRYISWPGQALAYKIGELRILALRKAAEERLGEKFNLRAFHDALLSGGAMPIDVLEAPMHRWIETQSAAAGP